MRFDRPLWTDDRMTSASETRARRRARKSGRAEDATARSGVEVPAAAAQNQREVDEIVGKGPSGAMALAGSAVAIVVALWIAFYLFVFLPRS
jgi:hypothetical protein